MITSASGARLSRSGATALLAVATAFTLSAAPVHAATGAGSSTARPSSGQAAAPPGRTWASFACDAAAQTAITYGGFSDAAQHLDDTWTWTSTTWTQLHPTTSPGPGPARPGLSSPPPSRHPGQSTPQ